MLTPIHRALGLPPGPFDVELLRQCTMAQVPETDQLDWKRSIYSSQDPKWREEAAKDIAAMANSDGGWIVFGVEDQNDRAFNIKPVNWIPREEQRLRQAAYTHIAPPITGLEFYAAAVDGGFVVAMRVSASPDRPHLSRRGADTFLAPQRNGAHTVFMSEREIERAYRLRFQGSLAREQEIASLFEETSHALDRENGACLVFVAVPATPRSGQEISEQIARRLYETPEPSHLFGALSQSLGAYDVSPGLRSWILRERGRQPRRTTMHADGTFTAIHRLGGWHLDGRSAPYYPAEPNHCMSKDVESSIAECFAHVRTIAKQIDVQGGYTARIGLVGRPEEPLYIRTTEGSGNYLLSADQQEPIRSFRNLTVGFDPLSSDHDLHQIVWATCLDFVNQGGVRYLKLIKEVPTEDH